MNRRFAPHLTALALALLCLAPAHAAVQVRARVCSLGVGSWYLCEKDGRAYLTNSGRRKAPKWFVSAPTVKDDKGRLLSADPKGLGPSVHVVRDRGPHAQWTFEVLHRFGPGRSREEPRLKEGYSGFLFKLKVAGGPYKGWYLAAEDLSEGQKKRSRVLALRPLKLVKEPENASIFTYTEQKFEVGHP